MLVLVRAIDCLSPGVWRVIAGPGCGMLDGGSEQDWPQVWIPTFARQPTGELGMTGFLGGVQQWTIDENSTEPSCGLDKPPRR